MLNVPWFGWLNVVGLLLLWALYVFAHHVAESETSFLERASSHIKIVGSFAFVLVVWNAQVVEGFYWAIAALAAIVVPLVAWEVAASAWEIVKEATGARKEGDTNNREEPRAALHEEAPDETHSSRSASAIPAHAIDLDAGTVFSEESQLAIGGAIKKVCGSTSSDRDRIQGLMSLANAVGDEEEEDDGIDLISTIIGALLAMTVLVPPSYMAVMLLLG